jgi:hypothetical protein
MKVSSTTKNGKRIWQRVIETCLTDNKELPLGLGHDSELTEALDKFSVKCPFRYMWKYDVLIGKYIFLWK